MKNKENQIMQKENKNDGVNCQDIDCPQHCKLRMHGRIFQGLVTHIFPRRLTIEFDRIIYIRKYERYMKKRTKIHARVPACLQQTIAVGDLIRVQECRPLSKIIHHVVKEVVQKK